MTVPYYIQDHITHSKTQVPYDIIHYCDHITVDADRYDLRYKDCVYMHMGYYGNNPDILKKFRDEYFSKPHPVFE